MNILMLTNTFTPHVGGVARSVETFAEEYRRRGHGVLIVAPKYAEMPFDEQGVVRVSAIQNFNASDFSVALPFHQGMNDAIDVFKPDIVHSQHPFLLGMTALRAARYRQLPLVFTHHTLYEQYTHYVPGDSPAFRRFVIELATRYANHCDQVFAPSESVRSLLQERGVESPIEVVPTGIKVEKFSHGDGGAQREKFGIPQDAFVVGHLGRLAPEKNLEFMTQAVVDFMVTHPNSYFLVIGKGPSEEVMHSIFHQAGLHSRLVMAGVMQQQPLADALHAMDIFAFASRSETQGIVLTEAMAAGLPVVALDAPGVREVVQDRSNGRLLQEDTAAAFRDALAWVAALAPEQMAALKRRALATAENYSTARCADKALACYEALVSRAGVEHKDSEINWEDVLTWIKTEWSILKSVAEAGDAAIGAVRDQDQGVKQTHDRPG